MSLVYLTPLSPSQQAVEGIDPVQPLAIADRVRYSELDVLNHVNNKVYMEWFERLRVLYGQAWGITNLGNDGRTPRTVIRSGSIHFREEIKMDSDYIATCRCTAFRTTSYTLAQQIWSGGTLRATFDCVMVLLDAQSPTKVPIPQAMRDRFEIIDGASFEG
ncbi:Thioesterase-like protein [Sulfitobacter noctilucicola]|uniref:Acyl-CoA thioester hydrolase n=1 Tax=Sulfitobacter noctilucicola TaxID=1342301 RepID=A0A7W6M960_9RHOB|nr:thioesterase family protein [Sulfitobacter noctilucicola]KIN65096.1 Thioesterase-like protein [Sulfitobacter noctilucicola]MBB4173766.1 acyl-CoA thioester hydrolase [Sulfitobacter noctilucicola]